MISILYEVGRYRDFLNDAVCDGSVVIEIGPHVGKSTGKYVVRTRLTVAVDIGKQAEESMGKLSERHENLVFVRGDARSFDTVRKVLELTDRCDVLAVDLGGGRYPDTVYKVWAVWSGVFQPRHSVLRNRGLAEFLQRAHIADDSVKKVFSDDGWMSTWGRTIPSKLEKQLEEFGFWTDLKSRKKTRE